jgi:basic amino acid/polyamine antiporter, APA family
MAKLLSTLFRTKPINELTAEDDHGDGPKLAKVLTARDVFFHGVAAIIGTGIFVLTGVAAAQHAGPAIILSFVIAGLACTFVSFAYSELASMIPKSGSAYTYAYATLGELIAWFIGWDLLLEYCVGASAVAVGWSGYMQNILRSVGIELPAYLAKAPADMPWQEVGIAALTITFGIVWLRRIVPAFKQGAANAGTYLRTIGTVGLFAVGGYYAVHAASFIHSIDILAVSIIAFLNFWLIKGVSHTAKMTAWFVVIKLAVIAMFIAIGMWHVDTANFVPFIPPQFGWMGVITGAAVVFFAYIGFDAVSTLPEECKNPKRDMPRGIIGSLIVCATLYIIVAAIMTGAVHYSLFDPSLPSGAAPMATVLNEVKAPWWASPLVSLGAIAGITSVLIVLLFGQSRVMMSMSRDGLISPIFSKIHPKFQTPMWSIIIWGVLAALTAGLLPIGALAELTSIGTLAAFVLCCVGVIVLRRTEPNRERKFRCPRAPLMVPAARLFSRLLPSGWRAGFVGAVTWLADNLVPVLGALFSIGLMLSLPGHTWTRFIGWMVIGMAIYYMYGRHHSVLGRKEGKK